MTVEGYRDPTADQAIGKVNGTMHKNAKKAIKEMYKTAHYYGFAVEGRIVLRDKKTGSRLE